MYTNTYAILLIGLVIIFITRLLPRLKYSNIVGQTDDFWNFILTSKAIKHNSHRIPDKIDNFMLPDNMDYPPLLPWLFSFIPEKFVMTSEKYYSVIVDSFYLCLFWFCCNLNVPAIALPLIGEKLFIAIILFSLHPLFFLLGRGPRTFQTTPRSMSELIVFGCLFFQLLWIVEHTYIYLFIAIIFGIIQTITNRFGLQVIILVNFFLSIIYNDIQILLIPFIIILISFVILGRKWGRVLMGSIGHALFMRRLWYHPNRISRTFLKDKKENYSIRSILKNIKQNELMMAFLSSPIIIIIILLFYRNMGNDGIQIMHIELGASLIIIILSLVALIFNTKDLMFWGSGDRYLFYSIPFQVFIIVGLTSEMANIIFYYSLVLSLLYFIICIRTLKKKDIALTKLIKYDQELFNLLNSKSDRPSILPIWGGRVNKLIYYTNCVVPDIQYSYKPWMVSYETVKEIYAEYGYLNPVNLDKLVHKYSSDFIVVRKSALTSAKEYFDLEYDFNNYNLVQDNEHYVVYET